MAGTLEENGGSRCIRKQLPACFGDWDGEFGASRRCDAQPLSSQQESALKVLGTDGLFLFSSLDTDQDMYISPEEFKPIAEKLTGTREAGKPKRTWALTPPRPPTTHHFLVGGYMSCLGPKPISVVTVAFLRPPPSHILNLKPLKEVQPLHLSQAWGRGTLSR